jgi:hypothetical protein
MFLMFVLFGFGNKEDESRGVKKKQVLQKTRSFEKLICHFFFKVTFFPHQNAKPDYRSPPRHFLFNRSLRFSVSLGKSTEGPFMVNPKVGVESYGRRVFE